MENFEFYSPTFFKFGRGTEADTGTLAKQFGAKKVLLHYGTGSVIKTGLLGRVKKSLDDAGIAHIALGGAVPNPVDSLVYEGIELARRENIDFIIAVGGGSAIDSAKAIAAGVPYSGDFWDFFSGKAVVETAIPVGVVLTISAAGSEGSTNTVITGENGKAKRGTGSLALRPKFAVLNPELTTTLPAYQVACGGSDIMAHLFERYFTHTKNVETTDQLIEALLRAMIIELPKAVKNPADYEAQANIMWAGMLAHNNVVGVGRVQDWSSHKIEHELSAMYDVAHGAGLAVVFPAWMKYTIEKDRTRFERLAKNVWGKDTAEAGIDALKEFYRGIGLPTTFLEIEDANAADIPALAAGVPMPLGNFANLTAADIEKIYALMV